MTSITIRGQASPLAALVTCGTCLRDMRAGKREQCFGMIKRGRLPALRRVATRARLRETDMRWTTRRLKILLMTRITIRAQSRPLAVLVTCGTCLCCVRAGERELCF